MEEAIEGLGPNPTDEELQDELVFTRICIESADPEAFDYEEMVERYSKKIEQIERRLGIEGAGESPQGQPQSQFLSLTPQQSQNPFEDLLGPVASYNALDEAGMSSTEASSRRPITPPHRRRQDMNEYIVDTGSRKRPANALSSSPVHGTPPAKRATPSPGDRTPQTPGSDALPEATLFDFAQASNGYRSVGQSSRTVSDSFIERQRQIQRDAEERRARLVRDTQIANSINLGLPVQRSTPAQSSTQAVLNRDGTFRRVSSIKAEPSSFTNAGSAGVATNQGFAATASSTANVKNEFGNFPQRTSQTPFVPQDNKPRGSIQIDSDSDLEEIDAETFNTASRRNEGSRRSNGTQSAQSTFQPQSRMPPAMYVPSGSSYGAYGAQQGPPGNPLSTLQQYQQAYGMMQQANMGFMAGDPRAVGVRQAMHNYSMPGAFPGSGDLLGHFVTNGVGGQVGRIPGLASQYDPNATRTRIPVIDLDDDSDDLGEYNYLRSDPSRTKEDLEALVLEAAKGELSPDQLEGTPEAFKLPLMPHQKVGVAWMKDKEAGTSKGGILADDMGLGKTIQALAVIVSSPSEDRARKTTLVVAPVALIYQWEAEIKDKIKKEKALKVFVHHSQKKKAFRVLREYDVVLTTYGSLAAELKRLQHWASVIASDPQAIPTQREQMSLIGPDCKWYRVILDEAQCIKNSSTSTAKASFKIDAIYRWCMTGTPMMNNVGELWSLIHFCRIRPYNSLTLFRSEIKNPLEKRYEGGRQQAMKKLQALIRAVMLRRTKTTKIDGKPIITLPPRTNEVITREFEKDQLDFYQQVEQKSATIFNKYLKEGSVMRNYSHVLTLLLRLRQITDHPTLATVVVDDSGVETTEREMIALARKLKAEVVRRLKDQNDDFTCPICIDAIPPPGPVIFFPCGHFLDNDCLSSLAMNAQANMETEVKCPECREKFDPKKVIDYPTFKKVHAPETIPQEADKPEKESDAEDSDTDSDDDDGDGDGDDTGSLRDFIDDDEEEATEAAGVDDEADLPESGESSARPVNSFLRNGSGGPTKRKKDKKGKDKKGDKKKKSLAELRKEGRKNKKNWQKYLRRLEKTWESSAKIEQTLELLEKIDAEKPREKVLIFSQFTSFLDFIEVPLRRRGYGYQRYDGSMNAQAREAAVLDFKTNSHTKLMLISLKAGNAGLNLNCASQVIILDPFWNPFIEEQAIDRAHRIGQQHEVNVYRIVIPNTVEDRILQLQDKKRDLINTALDENEGKKLARLGVRELQFLFGQRPDPGI